MGGRVPLGYRAEGRTLEVVPAEAETVRLLFQLYLEVGSVRKLKQQADRRGLRTKVHVCKKGKKTGGGPFGRGGLYHLLSNPIYAGRVPHKEDSYAGQHPAIVDPETWEAVQKQLADQAPAKSIQSGEPNLSPLRGKLFDASAARLTPSHTVKSGRRYRYYVSRSENENAKTANGEVTTQWRLPAREIERFVGEAVIDLMRNSGELSRLARAAGVPHNRLPGLVEQARAMTHEPLSLVERVELSADAVTIQIGLGSLSPGGDPRSISLEVPVRLRRRGVEQKLSIPGADSPGSADGRVDASLLQLIARSRCWFEAITSGRVSSFKEIAQAEGVSEQFVSNRIRLALLSPEIVERICRGTQPDTLSADALVKRIELPPSWAEQTDRVLLSSEADL